VNFDSEQIIELLKSDNLHFRKIAFKTIVDEFEIFSKQFFDIISEGIDCDDLINYACQRFPSLNSGFDEATVFVPSKTYLYFAEYANEHKLFLKELQKYFHAETCPEKREKLIVALSKCFEGLKSDLFKTYPQYKNSGNTENETDRQLMLFITGKCNLSCPYCFSNELQPQEMSLPDFAEILQWAHKNKVKRISLCGGEPTSHSRFDEILLMMKEQAYKTYFASNFTLNCKALKNFTADVIDKIYVHLTDQALENQYLMRQIIENVEYAEKAGIELMFRTNIADGNPKIKEWFRIIQATQITALNIALTFPTPSENNQFVDADSFEQYAFTIEEIIKKSNELKYGLSFAKPIPLCIFDKQTSRFLLANKKFHPLCGINYHNCTHNVCINHKKEFHACLGVRSSSFKFHKDIDWQEIETYCKNTIQALLALPLFTRCNNCFLFDRKLCQGACLSYKSVL
jgi:organic radical activating enzyme